MRSDLALRQTEELLQAALRCQQAGEFEQAQGLCERVCELVPEQADALHLLAIVSAQSGRPGEAEHWFARAIAAAPGRADFYGNFANALWEQGRMDEAIAACRTALAVDANQAEIHNVLGIALLACEQADEAAACFRQALALQPAYPHAANNLGNALQKLKLWHDAIAAYRQAIALQPDYAEAFNNLGQALKAQGQIAEAALCFSQALALRPGLHNAAQALAEVSPAWLRPLEGKTLLLRRYAEQDAAFLHGCFKNERFMAMYHQYMPRHERIETLRARLRQAALLHPCQSKSVDWLIVRKSDGQAIGLANLTEIQFTHRRAEFLIGIPAVADQTTGAGLEAALLVLDFAFNRVGLHKLTNIVYADNEAAQKNTLALGFVAEGRQREHIAGAASGRLLDIHNNGMTEGDFRASARLAKLAGRLLGRDITSPEAHGLPRPAASQ